MLYTLTFKLLGMFHVTETIVMVVYIYTRNFTAFFYVRYIIFTFYQ